MGSNTKSQCRLIEEDAIRDAVKDLCVKAATELPQDVVKALKEVRDKELSAAAKTAMDIILKNQEIARKEGLPICQDTGLAYVFLEVGQDVKVNGNLHKAIAEGVSLGYKDGFLRKSVVSDPLFNRVNTGDNTPPIIHFEIASGDKIRITLFPKGVGSENMSGIKMLTPAEGIEGVKRFIVETVEKGAPNACPPLIVGVGIGGMMDYAAYLAKKALLRPLGEPNKDARLADLELEILQDINKLGIGPGGLGGKTTALAVHINTYPTHIGTLPVAVNLQCHAARRASTVL